MSQTTDLITLAVVGGIGYIAWKNGVFDSILSTTNPAQPVQTSPGAGSQSPVNPIHNPIAPTPPTNTGDMCPGPGCSVFVPVNVDTAPTFLQDMFPQTPFVPQPYAPPAVPYNQQPYHPYGVDFGPGVVGNVHSVPITPTPAPSGSIANQSLASIYSKMAAAAGAGTMKSPDEWGDLFTQVSQIGYPASILVMGNNSEAPMTLDAYWTNFRRYAAASAPSIYSGLTGLGGRSAYAV